MRCQALEMVSVAAGACGHGAVGFVTFLAARDLLGCDGSGLISV